MTELDATEEILNRVEEDAGFDVREYDLTTYEDESVFKLGLVIDPDNDTSEA